MTITILYRLLWILMFVAFIGHHSFYYSRRVHVLNFQLAFLFKLVAAVMMMYIYTHIYTDRATADIFRYYDDSRVLCHVANNNATTAWQLISGNNDASLFKYRLAMNNWETPHNVYNNNRVMIIANALIGFVSLGDYYIHLILFTFLAFTGLVAIYKVISKIYNTYPGIVFIAIFTLPGSIFWTSGVLKESLVVLALGMLLFCYMRFYFNSAVWYHLPVFIVSFALLAVLKFYMLLIIIPALAMLLLCQRVVALQRHTYIAWALFVTVFVSVVFGFRYINPHADVLQALMAKRQAFELLAMQMKAGSYYHAPSFQSLTELIAAAPLSFVNVLVRPFLFLATSWLEALSALENIFILILCLLATIFRRRNNFFVAHWNAFFVVVIVSTFTLIGLTVPVVGAIVRYKSTVLPLLTGILLCNIDYQKLVLKFPRLQKVFDI